MTTKYQQRRFQGFGFSHRLDCSAAAIHSQRGPHTLWVGGRAKRPIYGKRLTLKCERGDSNPQEILLSLPPQGSVSTSSTTSASVTYHCTKEKQ